MFLHRYSFAIVGINLTHLAYNLWKDGTVKTHAYNLLNSQQFIPTVSRPAVLHFHRFYCFLFFEFDKLWMTGINFNFSFLLLECLQLSV